MRINHRLALLIAAGLVPALVLGCGKKKDSDDDEDSDPASAPPASSGGGGGDSVASVQFAGTIPALGLALAGSEYDVVAFQLEDGQLSKDLPMKEIALDAAGRFEVDFDSADQTSGDLARYLNSDGSLNRDLLLAEHPEVADKITGRSDAEAIAALTEDDDGRPKDITWALVLRNKTVDATDRLASLERFIGVRGGAGTLYGMRPGDMRAGSAVDLGNVGASGEADATLDDLSGSFSSQAAVDAAKEVARTNKALQVLANVYANANPAAGTYWEFTPFFTFNGQASVVQNAYSSPVDVAYENMGVYVSLEDAAHLTFAEMCGDATVEMVPPAAISFDGHTFGPDHPISNVGHGAITQSSSTFSTTSECGNDANVATAGPLFVRKFDGDGGERFLFNTTIEGTPPEGVWKMRKNGTEIAQFNVSPALPLDAAGNPVVYMPSVQVDVDPATQVITGIHVRFYVYENGAYAEVTDLEGFRKVVTSVNYGLSDYDGATVNNNQSIEAYEQIPYPATGNVFSATDLEHSFLFPGNSSSSSLVAGTINISYDMYGNRYRFDFRVNN